MPNQPVAKVKIGSVEVAIFDSTCGSWSHPRSMDDLFLERGKGYNFRVLSYPGSFNLENITLKPKTGHLFQAPRKIKLLAWSDPRPDS